MPRFPSGELNLDGSVRLGDDGKVEQNVLLFGERPNAVLAQNGGQE